MCTTEKAMEFEKQANEAMINLLDAVGRDSIIKMDETEYRAVKSLFAAANASIDLAIEQAKALDEANDKLNRLLEKVEALSK